MLLCRAWPGHAAAAAAAAAVIGLFRKSDQPIIEGRSNHGNVDSRHTGTGSV